jgi:hypothetical protein
MKTKMFVEIIFLLPPPPSEPHERQACGMPMAVRAPGVRSIRRLTEFPGYLRATAD